MSMKTKKLKKIKLSNSNFCGNLKGTLVEFKIQQQVSLQFVNK